MTIEGVIMLKEMKQKLVKKAIIDETKKQLLKKGIHNTSLRGIAKGLGIAFGNIYCSKSYACRIIDNDLFYSLYIFDFQS